MFLYRSFVRSKKPVLHCFITNVHWQRKNSFLQHTARSFYINKLLSWEVKIIG
jgi:hypothetical protein